MALMEAFRASWLISCMGLLLFLTGICVLYRNEGLAVDHAMSLRQALDDVYIVKDPNDSSLELEGRLVHIAGPIICGEPLTAPDYNLQVQAVKLKRRVFMYQWVEEVVEHAYGESADIVETNSKTYYYKQEWMERLVDSRQFYNRNGHENPKKFPFESGVLTADAVYLGKYELSNAAKKKINNFMPLTSDTRPESSEIKLHAGVYYHTADVFSPKIGDLRVSFQVAGLETTFYTIVGKVQNNKIVPYATKRGIDVLLLSEGEHSVHAVFQKERYMQRFGTWGRRFAGWVLIFFAVTCTSKLLHIILTNTHSFVFLAPDEVHATSGNLLLSLSMALVIAAVAWFIHRPIMAAALLLAAVAPHVWSWRGFL